VATGDTTKADPDDPDVAGLDLDERSTLARVEQRMFGATTTVRIDRYEVQEPLGGGGMGVVFAAWDPELRRRVAIKLVQVHGGEGKGTGGAARLLREAQAIARISHPHVVPVHDVGTYGDDGDGPGLPGAAGHGVFLVMELVAGVDLGRWLDERARPWSEVLDAFLAAGQGLAAAHACGILHRDFKPSNVLVGADGRVRVLDFGLARSIDGVDDVEREVGAASGEALLGESMTRTGTVLGTP
jgi:eukaryotic-like serine/threonine-protein kinase